MIRKPTRGNLTVFARLCNMISGYLVLRPGASAV